jgi:hypothetical protein
MIEGSTEQCHDFLERLYGSADSGWITIWIKTTHRTLWFPADRGIERAARAIAREAQQSCVYISWGLQERPLHRTRGGDRTVTTIPGLWADVDIRDADAHTRSDLPPSRDAALEAIAAFPLKPTTIVHSGHGLYPMWLFREPLELDSDEDRSRAAQLLRGLQAALKRICLAPHGWTLDHTHALSHLLRPVGSTNHKTEPVPVTITQASDVRYTPDDFEPFIEPVERARPATRRRRRHAATHPLDEELLDGTPMPGERHHTLIHRGLLIYAWSAYGPDEGYELLKQWSTRGCDQGKARERIAELRSAWKLLDRRISQGQITPMEIRTK